MLSVIVPTLNAAGVLSAALASIAAGGGLAEETVVADGGSEDGTAGLAARLGARVLDAPRGRGAQLAAGAEAARGDWLLFLHADTVLAGGWAEAARAFMEAPGNRRRAAVFRLKFADDAPAARRLERIVAWRTRRLGLPYGDQGLLITRDFYAGLGGFRPLPIMEDVDLARRIGRRRMTVLAAEAVTSAARYEKGYLRRSARNLFCLTLFLAGVPPRWIKRLYG